MNKPEAREWLVIAIMGIMIIIGAISKNMDFVRTGLLVCTVFFMYLNLMEK